VVLKGKIRYDARLHLEAISDEYDVAQREAQFKTYIIAFVEK
jgi:hypothetical protein